MNPGLEYIRWKLGIVTEDLPFLISDQLRYHPGREYWHPTGDGQFTSLGKFPAIVAAITGLRDELLNVQTIYLTEGGRPAPVPSFKKLMPSPVAGCTIGGAVKLHRPDKHLGIAEGVMTALAARYDTGLPVWAAISAQAMKSVIIPPSVEKIAIFADNDESGTGQREALEAARRFKQQDPKRVIKIMTPDQLGSDWADVVNKKNEELLHYAS